MVELARTPGFATAPRERPGLSIAVEPPRGCLTAQLHDPARATALTPLLGFAAPPPGRIEAGDRVACCSVAPGEWLVITEAEAALPALAGAIAAALANDVALVTDVSDALVLLHVSGDDAATVLAAHCPIDLHQSAFPPGSAARSLFGETIAVITRPAEALAYQLIIDQTAAPYVWRQLVRSGFPPG